MGFQFVQGRTNNHLTWAMVDATDFATPESALSAATKIKIYGTLETATGVNFVSSGTGSLTNDIVHVGASVFGLYHIALAKADLSDASAAWYDEYIVVLSATGAAQQVLVVEGVRTDTSYISNLLSNLSAISSDIYSALTITNSRVLVTQSAASDAASAAQQANSRVLLNQSRISDAYSMLSDFYSDFQSRVPKAVATNSQLSDLHSDLRSYLVVMSGVQSDLYSALSDFQSDFQSRVPKRVATDSQLSDLASDLKSAIAGVTATVGASDISDIASAVYAALASDVSDLLSRTTQINSRVLLNQSRISDVYSQVAAGVTLTTAGAQAVADEFLNRNLAGGGSGNTRNVRNALRALRNKTGIVAGVGTVYQEDDLTAAWSATVSTAAGDPIVTIDPS